jgi:hypothetical protein
MKVDMRRAMFGLVLATGCGSSSAGPDAAGPARDSSSNVDGALIDAPPHIPGNPSLGGHGLHFYAQPGTEGAVAHDSDTLISTPAFDTQPSGSTIVVSVGRGKNNLFAPPTDNQGNSPYQQVEAMHPYTGTYPDSGTALYAFASAAGGDGFRVSNTTDAADEITLAAVEVVDSSRIAAHAWKYVACSDTSNQATCPDTTTSDSVMVTDPGPATLIAFWWGDANQYFDKTAVPGDGFTRIDSVLKVGSLVQCAVAVKNVTGPGTYQVSWTATPRQGAQLYLIAVQ